MHASWKRRTLERYWSICESQCVQHSDHRKLAGETLLCLVIYNHHVSAFTGNLRLLSARNISNDLNHSNCSSNAQCTTVVDLFFL